METKQHPIREHRVLGREIGQKTRQETSSTKKKQERKWSAEEERKPANEPKTASSRKSRRNRHQLWTSSELPIRLGTAKTILLPGKPIFTSKTERENTAAKAKNITSARTNRVWKDPLLSVPLPNPDTRSPIDPSDCELRYVAWNVPRKCDTLPAAKPLSLNRHIWECTRILSTALQGGSLSDAGGLFDDWALYRGVQHQPPSITNPELAEQPERIWARDQLLFQDLLPVSCGIYIAYKDQYFNHAQRGVCGSRGGNQISAELEKTALNKRWNSGSLLRETPAKQDIVCLSEKLAEKDGPAEPDEKRHEQIRYFSAYYILPRNSRLGGGPLQSAPISRIHFSSLFQVFRVRVRLPKPLHLTQLLQLLGVFSEGQVRLSQV